MEIRLAADLQTDSVVDGEGIRTVIWTQGCPHNCLGCHNPNTHDFNDGEVVDVMEVLERIDELDNQDGITFSGGDPMCQPRACAKIAEYAKNKGLNIWCYTGYTYEQLQRLAKLNKDIIDFLNLIDVLIDGPFILKQKSLDLKFRGSKNQRLIDVPKTLESNEIVLVTEKEPISFSKPEGIYI
ncbi:MAG: anaerobic ribonucleoside-triphosphate reductase activating protein [Bacilli bacterium]